MSIVIKGTKMYKNCIECPMQFGGFCYVTPPEIDAKVAPTVDEAVKQGKPDWCPMSEVKTPHGRLVDVDALIAQYDAQHEGEPGRARKLMEDAPTIIEAEMDNTKSDEKYLQKLMQEIFSKTLILESTTGELHEVIHIDDLKDIFREVMGWMI